jgi:hypothetical protein
MKSIAAAIAIAFGLGGLCAGCGAANSVPDADWPAGALLSARTETLRGVLAGLGRQETTPLGRTARAWLAALPDCPEVEAHAPGGDFTALPSALQCVADAPARPGFRAWRGEAELALAVPLGDASRLRLRGHESGDGLTLDVAWPDAPGEGLLGSLLPGDHAAGPAVLARTNPVIHARARGHAPLDLGALAPEGSQGDQLFRLRSELFGTAVLDGSWELAVYPPAAGQSMPQVALALGVGMEAIARRALDGFIGELEQTWELRRTPAAFGEAAGSCLLELALLPDFAPCAVTTRSAVIVGWNGASVRAALAEPTAQDTGGTPGRLAIDLDRLRATDEALGLGNAAAETVGTIGWPWQRVVVEGRRAADELELSIALVGPKTSGS